MLNEARETMVMKYLCGKAACHDESAAKELCDALLELKLEEIPALFLKHKALCEVTSGSIPQLSDLAVALYRVPKVLLEAGAPLSYEELGKQIYPSQSSGAQGKYGEGHGKLAVALDLASCTKQNGHWVFGTTIMGKYFCGLKQEEKDQLLQRLCYRVPIIQHMAISSDPRMEMETCFAILSESTRNRRRRNVLDLYDFATDA